MGHLLGELGRQVLPLRFRAETYCLTGGQHFRAWKQNGTLADSGAWYIGYVILSHKAILRTDTHARMHGLAEHPRKKYNFQPYYEFSSSDYQTGFQ